MNSLRKVVVTGLGVASPLGLGVEENWQKALAGMSGITSLELPDTEPCPIRAVGAVTEHDWKKITADFPEEASSEGERRTLFALWAASSALTDAGLLDEERKRDDCGVVFAAGMALCMLEDIQRWIDKNGQFDFAKFGREYALVSKQSVIRNPSHRPAALMARKFRLGGPNSTITSACASATQAIGIGYRTIQRGDADCMVVGGADSMINPVGLAYFVLLQAASTSTKEPQTVCRPFDRKRSGVVIGEGAGVAVLEEESRAKKRGARIYGEVVGYGSSLDAYQLTAPLPSGQGAARSMAMALRDANLTPQEIDYINAHGTGTKLNDVAETLAIKEVFGEWAGRLSISSSKSMIGHLMAAAGGPEFVFTVLSVQRDEIHPTINLQYPDPKCDLDYVPNVKKALSVRAALSNSFGFGGQNASVVVKKYGNAAHLSET